MSGLSQGGAEQKSLKHSQTPARQRLPKIHVGPGSISILSDQFRMEQEVHELIRDKKFGRRNKSVFNTPQQGNKRFQLPVLSPSQKLGDISEAKGEQEDLEKLIELFEAEKRSA